MEVFGGYGANSVGNVNVSSLLYAGSPMRFQVNIPKGSTINNAYFSVCASTTLSTNSVKSTIRGYKVANSTRFSTDPNQARDQYVI